MNIQKNEGLLQAQTRLTEAKADIAELKRDILAEKLVPIEEVQKEWNEAVVNVKSKLESLPEIAPMLHGLEIREIKDILKRKVTEIENELAKE